LLLFFKKEVLPSIDRRPRSPPGNVTMRPAWTEPGFATLAFWLAYAACFIPEIAGSFFQKSAPSDRRQDRGSQAILIAGTIISLFVAFNIAFNAPSLDIAANGKAILVTGTVVIAAGIVFRWYAIWVLGRFFTRDVAIREGHRIVRAGPYRLLRHPSYTGYLLAMVGIGIAPRRSANPIFSTSARRNGSFRSFISAGASVSGERSVLF
jgi:protein-S-isoprenylcysteine O-methyltransferase